MCVTPNIYKFVKDNKKKILVKLNKHHWDNGYKGQYIINMRVSGEKFLNVVHVSDSEWYTENCRIYPDDIIEIINNPMGSLVLRDMFLLYQRQNTIKNILKE